MIHQLLNLTRPLFVPDAETTGVDPESSRIIEFGFQQWTAEGMVREWRSYINPGISIPAHTTKVHGIDDGFIKQACRHCQGVHDETAGHEWAPLPTFAQLAASFVKGFSDCDFAGKNVRFDLRILAAEMRRAGIEWSYAGARIIDIDRLEALVHPRDLSSLHAKYIGLPHDGAHGALSDVRASTSVIVRQLQEHESLPKDLDALHTLQWPGWLTSDGKFRIIDGVAMICFGKHKYTPIREVPIDYWDWLLREKFPPEIKQIVLEAKLGKVPE